MTITDIQNEFIQLFNKAEKELGTQINSIEIGTKEESINNNITAAYPDHKVRKVKVRITIGNIY